MAQLYLLLKKISVSCNYSLHDVDIFLKIIWFIGVLSPGGAGPSVDRWVPPCPTLSGSWHPASGAPNWVLLGVARLTPTDHPEMPHRTPNEGFPRGRFSTCLRAYCQAPWLTLIQASLGETPDTGFPGSVAVSIDRWVPPWSTLGVSWHQVSVAPDWVLLGLHLDNTDQTEHQHNVTDWSHVRCPWSRSTYRGGY